MAGHEVGEELRRAQSLLDGRVVAASHGAIPGHDRVDDRRHRIERQRLAPLALRLVEAAHGGEELGVPLMRGGVVGIQFDRASVFALRGVPIPLVRVDRIRQRRVRLGQLIVDRQRLLRRRPRAREGLFRRQPGPDIEQVVDVGQAGVRQRVLRIDLDGLVEVLDGLVQPLGVALVPLEAALEVQLVRARVAGLLLGQELLLAAAELQPQRARDLAGDGLLHGIW